MWESSAGKACVAVSVTMPTDGNDGGAGEEDQDWQMAGEEGESGGDGDREPDWEMAPDAGATFPEDAEKREVLREVAEEVRARDDSSEASQVAAFLYRVSDLYKEGEETSPAEIYLNMRHIMDIKAQGGLDRGREE